MNIYGCILIHIDIFGYMLVHMDIFGYSPYEARLPCQAVAGFSKHQENI